MQADADPVRRNLSLAWPLACVYLVLVFYASLYPFTGWRMQGIVPWAYLTAPWPPFLTTFDLLSNFLGYIPLGLLLTLALARTGAGRGAWLGGLLLPCAVSLLLESAQGFLMHRVPSQVDLLLNTLGAAAGMIIAVLALRWRLLDLWSLWRRDGLLQQTYGGVLVLVLWPFALLYPSPVPFGLGQVWLRLDAALQHMTAGSVLSGWLPRFTIAAPTGHVSEAALVAMVALCVWAPMLLGFALLRGTFNRLAFVLVSVALAFGASALSASLTYGPEHAWVWLTATVGSGLAVAAVMTLFSLALGHRAAAVLSLLAWMLALWLLNRAPEAAYFAQSLQVWEQGRFMRIHGLSQWLGWLWPYAALVVGLRLALRPSSMQAQCDLGATSVLR